MKSIPSLRLTTSPSFPAPITPTLQSLCHSQEIEPTKDSCIRTMVATSPLIFELLSIDHQRIPIERHILDRIPALQHIYMDKVDILFDPQQQQEDHRSQLLNTEQQEETNDPKININLSLFLTEPIQSVQPTNKINSTKHTSQSTAISPRLITIPIPIRAYIMTAIISFVQDTLSSEGKLIKVAETPVYGVNEDDIYELIEATMFLGL